MTTQTEEVVLIDLSSIAHPIWHTSQGDPDVNATSVRTVARVHALASGHAHVAICCDMGRSFRKEVDGSYKANRPAVDEALPHQIRLAKETLERDGFPVWGVDGLEGDDIIASTVRWLLDDVAARSINALDVLVVSSDKDLLQLVGPRVQCISAQTGVRFDTAGVLDKFGVVPAAMLDYLCLCGDASDNVKGANGIGPKRAAGLLSKFGSLARLYTELDQKPDGVGLGLKPSEHSSLVEFRNRLPTVQELLALRFDAELPYEDLLKPRVSRIQTEWTKEEEEQMGEEAKAAPEAAKVEDAVRDAVRKMDDGFREVEKIEATAVPAPAPSVAAPLALVPEIVPRVDVDWQHALEPRSMKEAQSLAVAIYESRLFSAYGSPPAVLTTIMAGREMGLQTMASLRAFHIIDGRPTLEASFIRSRVMRSGLAKYFRCVTRTNLESTWETERLDDPGVVHRITYTVEDARVAWTKPPEKFLLSGWGRNPADMCVARSSTKLARMVYPEVTQGFYAREEFDA